MPKRRGRPNKDESDVSSDARLPAKVCPEPRPTGIHSFTEDEVAACRQKLLQWYAVHQRVLPWRTKAKEEADSVTRAYAVWVSEIMLQQTQVATVVGYYKTWMEKWPTVFRLAEATLEEVHQVWSGLGYYSRGRRLHEGATKIVNELNGKIPMSAAELSSQLPGVGRYTSAAIASIAFGEKVGVLDGNVTRILSRLRRIGAEVNDAKTLAVLWSLADVLVDSTRPGDFNQAMMDLGATVCTPKSPKCSQCPLKDSCLAYAQHSAYAGEKIVRAEKAGQQIKAEYLPRDIEECAAGCSLCSPADAPWDPSKGVTDYPRKAQKKAARLARACVCVVKKDRKLLVVKRPSGGLLGGLWEFPSTPIADDMNNSEVRKAAAHFLTEQFSLQKVAAAQVHYAGDVLHKFSHIHQTYSVCCVLASSLPESLRDRQEGPDGSFVSDWVDTVAVPALAMSVAMRKVLATADGTGRSATTKHRISSPGQEKKVGTKTSVASGCSGADIRRFLSRKVV